ncbi:MAG: TolC family protein, partial [Ignavibacteriae bacterium]|nr:TolC family protein [Ignavibacteriota bacterium]
MLRKIFIYLIIFIPFACISYAQQVKIYTLQEAISTAYRNNSELINARLDKLKAEQKVKEVYNENLIPTITLNSNYSRAFKKQVFDIFGQRYEIGTDNALSNTLSITEPIPVLGTPVFQGINIARYYENLQTENVA